MNTLPRIWRMPNDGDAPFMAIHQVAIPGSDPLESYILPQLPLATGVTSPTIPLPTTAPPVAPLGVLPRPLLATPDEVIMIDLTTEIDLHGSAISASFAAGAAIVPVGPIASRTTYTSGAPDAYNITLQFKGTWTVALQSVFIAAADRLSAVIIGDLPNVRVGGATVDDIIITAELLAIDGPGGVLGLAGPTALRTGSFLPAAATMRFDSADAQAFNSQGLFDAIVTHEMLHSVGFGTIWSQKGLLTEEGFIGPNAMAQYAKLIDAYEIARVGSTQLANGAQLIKGAVPVETEGGAGTAQSHWSESVFDSELMTGWLDLPKFGSA